MHIFLTGATGYIGQKLALQLADEGHIIHALARCETSAKAILSHKNIRVFKGDILEKDSIKSASAGCEQVYHLAALASVWHPQKNIFYEVNVRGLANVLDACLENKIIDVLFTSSAAVAGHSVNGLPVSEYSNKNSRFETEYERTKLQAEELLKNYFEKGIRGIIVNPSRVYGPGLLTESNSASRLVQLYLNGHWHILPGDGKSMGNYAFIDDVVNGLILAMKKARPGERYLLGGENISFTDFFNLVDELAGCSFHLRKIPLQLMILAAHLQILQAKVTGKKPLISPPFVRKYNKNWMVDSGKAMEEIGYTITPLKTGLRKTIEWLQTL